MGPGWSEPDAGRRYPLDRDADRQGITQIEYKYTLGDFDHVEKDGGCGEINNRQLTLSYGASGTQAVNDTVGNWRNVTPCGN